MDHFDRKTTDIKGASPADRQSRRMKSSGSRSGRAPGAVAGLPMAMAPSGCHDAGTSSTSRTTSGQNIVEEIHAAPQPSVARATVGHVEEGQDHRGCAPQDVPALHAPVDGVLVEPIHPEIDTPPLLHRRQQRLAPLVEDDEAPWSGVVRRRCRDRHRDRPRHRRRVHGIVSEVPDGAARGHGIACALASRLRRAQWEEVLLEGAYAGDGARAVVAGDVVGEPAHERDRDPTGLALDEVCGRGDLIGHGDDGRLHGTTLRIGESAQVVEHGHAGDSDRGVGESVAPGPAQGVGHHDADAESREIA
jgi:hypothetical protein